MRNPNTASQTSMQKMTNKVKLFLVAAAALTLTALPHLAGATAPAASAVAAAPTGPMPCGAGCSH